MTYIIEPNNFVYDEAKGNLTHKFSGHHLAGNAEAYREKMYGKPVSKQNVVKRVESISDLPMVDFFKTTENSFYHVSDNFKAILDEHAPGCVEFFEIDLVTPPNVARPKRFYYINVIAREQTIDWEQTAVNCEPLHPNREICSPIDDFKVICKRRPDCSHIWHEVNLEQQNKIYRYYKKTVLVSDLLADILKAAFPSQIQYRHLIDSK
jgi:hypothetical protein